MKKHILIAGALVGVLFGQLFYWNWSISGRQEEIEARYIFMAPVGDSQNSNQTMFRNLIADGICRADDEFHTDTQLIACSDNDTIANYIWKGIYSDVDGIIISGYRDSENLAEAVREARGQGIPVALLDHKIHGIEYDCFVGIDNAAAGALAAETLSELITPGEHAAIVVTDLEGQNLILRAESFQEQWEEMTGTGEIQIIERNGKYLLLKQKMTELFEQDPEIGAIFCADAASSSDMKDLLNGIGKTDVSVIGFDLLPDILQYVREGAYASVIGQDTAEMGYQAVKYLSQNPQVREENEDSQEIQVPVFLVDRSNVDAYDGSLQEREEQKWVID